MGLFSHHSANKLYDYQKIYINIQIIFVNNFFFKKNRIKNRCNEPDYEHEPTQIVPLKFGEKLDEFFMPWYQKFVGNLG
jgi:hypothetical protein